MTVRELLERMDAREFAEWKAFAEIYPFPDPWQQSALMTSVMVKLWTSRKGKQFRTEDFMPPRRGAEPEKSDRPRQSVEQMKAIMGRFVAPQKGRPHGPE